MIEASLLDFRSHSSSGTGLPVRVDRVVKRYRPASSEERPALNAVSLDVSAGEWVVLMGDSGSGKSTLLNILAGVDYPDSGEILLGDISLTALDERQRTLFRRHRMGFVFQFFNLFPTLTAWENILLPLRLLGKSETDAARRLIGEVELEGKEHRYPAELSGGEQQRVALARALVHQPDLILADEPTGSLDHRTGLLVLSLLSRLHREYRSTIIMTTHSAEASRFGQRILHIRDGELVLPDSSLSSGMP
ncbi:MAG: ABC transporter ATP-binding protein [Leptospirales bacterium]